MPTVIRKSPISEEFSDAFDSTFTVNGVFDYMHINTFSNYAIDKTGCTLCTIRQHIPATFYAFTRKQTRENYIMSLMPFEVSEYGDAIVILHCTVVYFNLR